MYFSGKVSKSRLNLNHDISQLIYDFVVQMVEERQSRVDADVIEVAIEDKEEGSVLENEKQKDS